MARIILLLLLVLCRPAGAPPAARAADDTGEQSYDPADENQDGTVTNREARRYRRRMRRARRASSKNKSSSDAEDPPAAVSAPASGAGSSSGSSGSGIAGAGANALGKATSAADALKTAMPDASALDMPQGGTQGSMGNAKPTMTINQPRPLGGTIGYGGGTGKAGTGYSSGSPGNPAGMNDFILAAHGGYAPAFAAAGLKLSADGRTVVRLDGSPATADDLARLRQQIQAMPQALERRPDFFSVVSQDHFTGLKQGYHEHPELSESVYKHVATTPEDRDLVHTASCSKMSGDCNQNVEKESYKKGDFVAPEDLNRMWDALQKDLDQEASGDGPMGTLPSRNASTREQPKAGAILSGGETPSGASFNSVSAGGWTRAQAVSTGKAGERGLLASSVAGLVSTSSGAARQAGTRGLAVLAAGLLGVAGLIAWRSRGDS